MSIHAGAALLFLFGLFGQPQAITVRVTYYFDHGPNRWGGLYGCPLRAESGGGVATDNKVIPPGSLVLIPGVGLRRACDTGGMVRQNHIDLWVSSPQAGRSYTKRYGDYANVLVWPEQ